MATTHTSHRSHRKMSSRRKTFSPGDEMDMVEFDMHKQTYHNRHKLATPSPFKGITISRDKVYSGRGLTSLVFPAPAGSVPEKRRQQSPSPQSPSKRGRLLHHKSEVQLTPSKRTTFFSSPRCPP